MNLARIWVGGGVLAVLAVLVGGWLVAVHPLLAAAEDNRTQRASVAALVATQERQLADLEKQAENRPGLEADLGQLRAAMPADTAMPALVGELSVIAAAAGVRITAFGSSDGVVFADAAAAARTASTEGDADVAPTPGSGTVAIPVQITAVGSLDALLHFLAGVQDADRLLLTSGLTLALQEEGGEYQGALSGLAYASPQP